MAEGTKFQCARLQVRSILHHTTFLVVELSLKVPLNYSDPEGASAAIAMTRIPASAPPESAEYRGPLLINPGGPGGAGVDLVLAAGPLMHDILGSHFDILGFDPRGA